MLEKTLESPLDCKEFKPISPKEYQSRIFIERANVEAVPIPPDVKSYLIEKILMLGKTEVGSRSK